MPVLWGAIFAVALFPIFGWLKAKADSAVAGLETMAVRLAGERGVGLVTTSGATIRSVVQGVLGVAVILLGAIGGMMLSGIVGLFIGAVVLALGYQLLVSWVKD